MTMTTRLESDSIGTMEVPGIWWNTICWEEPAGLRKRIRKDIITAYLGIIDPDIRVHNRIPKP